MNKWLWLAFVVGAALSWGCYVPTLHEGQKLLGGVPGKGAWRAFLCVGIAYFMTAVIIPGGLLLSGQEETSFQPRGATFATLAGVLGAAGALCIIFAIKSGGQPMWVAPLVFGGAPIVNTIVTLIAKPPKTMPGPAFYVGILLAATGTFLVLYEKGRLEKPAAPTTAISSEKT